MLYTIGDSHSNHYAFQAIPEIHTNYIGPVTLKRVGYIEDDLVAKTISKLILHENDTIIFCFGEIDVRCFVHPNLQRKYVSLEDLLQDWVERYLTRITMLNISAKIGILSVVPPCPEVRIRNLTTYGAAGTDKERAEYTKKINEKLASGCKKYGFLYIDVYSKYKNEEGMIIKEYSDGNVHIMDSKPLRELLTEIGLI